MKLSTWFKRVETRMDNPINDLLADGKLTAAELTEMYEQGDSPKEAAKYLDMFFEI